MHASSLQLPTYAIFYCGYFEEGDEFTGSLAEDGTVHCLPVLSLSFFEDCEDHLALLHLHLAHQLHPPINNNTIIILLELTVTSGIEYVTKPATIFNTVFRLSPVILLLSYPVGHSDEYASLLLVDVGAEGEDSFPYHHIQQYHPP
jgi:hypothetical protein